MSPHSVDKMMRILRIRASQHSARHFNQDTDSGVSSSEGLPSLKPASALQTSTLPKQLQLQYQYPIHQGLYELLQKAMGGDKRAMRQLEKKLIRASLDSAELSFVIQALVEQAETGCQPARKLIAAVRFQAQGELKRSIDNLLQTLNHLELEPASQSVAP